MCISIVYSIHVKGEDMVGVLRLPPTLDDARDGVIG